MLIAERVAALVGRDDEFIAVMPMFWTDMGWAEVVGLGTGCARLGGIRVEGQL